MNFALSEEQEFLREAAQGALSRVKTLEAAREALEGAELPDLWPLAVEAGWPGLLVAEERGGAGLDPIDAMLVFEQMGRVLASVPLLGHVPATFVLDAASGQEELLGRLATGEARAALVPARPPDDLETRWTVDPEFGSTRVEAPSVAADGKLSGTVAWVPDAPGADALVVVAVDDGGAARAVLVEGLEVEREWRYDATRPLGHVRLDGVTGTPLEGVSEEKLRNAFFLEWTLLAAEALGATDRALEVSVQYSKERFTFGRPIGSYQAVKHQLVEILRLAGNSRSLMYYAGWAGVDSPGEFPLAAAAFRLSAGKALDDAGRTQISVHGGIGATWEHDAPLYFRRAQLSRRLLGGIGDAADRVASVLFEQARVEAEAVA
jgi:alkylation response protein AidB-like acyl-CoA dehydrogenase